MAPPCHVIIGNGIAGVSAARAIRARDDEARVVLVGEESRHFYARTALMWVYMGQLTLPELEPYEPWYWDEQRIELRQARVTAIERDAGRLRLAGGETLPFDTLLLAVGGSPNLFGWPGQGLDGVCTMTTLGDLRRLEAVRPRLRRAVIAGGGLIGIELVEMMLHDKVPVTYLVREPWYWDMALSEGEARLVEAQLRDHGVDLRLEEEIGEIHGTPGGQVEALTTKNSGQRLPCELVGVAVGVHANLELARQAGLTVERGIVVDERLCSSDPRVFAAGDCAEVRLPGREQPLLQKLWYTGIRQGAAAGRAMAGDEQARYQPAMPYNSAQFLFLDFVSVGWMPNMRPGLQEWIHEAAGARDSIRIAHDDGGRVHGLSMLGSRWNAGEMMRWIEQGRSLSWVKRHLDRAVFNEEFRKNRFAGLSRG